MKKRIAISGGSGFFGTSFFKQFKDKYKIYLIGNKNKLENFKIELLDLYNQYEVKKYLLNYKIKIFIHAAAITDVDYCERHPEEAFKANVELTRIVSKICKELNIFLVFISSDQIFNYTFNFKTEKHKPNPINVYGYTKYMAEKEVIKNIEKYLIIRTNFFGKSLSKKKSLSDWIVTSIKKRKKIKLFDDIIFNPVSIITLNKIIGKIIDDNREIRGIFNISSDEAISKYKFGKIICKKLNLDEKFIIKSKISQNKDLAIRPINMTLNNKKLKKKMNINKISISREFTNF